MIRSAWSVTDTRNGWSRGTTRMAGHHRMACELERERDLIMFAKRKMQFLYLLSRATGECSHGASVPPDLLVSFWVRSLHGSSRELQPKQGFMNCPIKVESEPHWPKSVFWAALTLSLLECLQVLLVWEWDSGLWCIYWRCIRSIAGFFFIFFLGHDHLYLEGSKASGRIPMVGAALDVSWGTQRDWSNRFFFLSKKKKKSYFFTLMSNRWLQMRSGATWHQFFLFESVNWHGSSRELQLLHESVVLSD